MDQADGCSVKIMSFGLDPTDWLRFLTESHEEYRQDPLSVRKAVTCCVFANHLPEHLVGKYGASDPGKLHGATSVDTYRDYLVTTEPALVVIRDLCDYAKHGPMLWRKSVTVAKAEQATTMELDVAGFVAFFPNHRPVEKLVVTLRDGSEGWVESYLRTAIDFWRAEFTACSL